MRNKYGILCIEITSDDIVNGEITLEDAIANHRDDIVEFIKNPFTSKLVYVTTPDLKGIATQYVSVSYLNFFELNDEGTIIAGTVVRLESLNNEKLIISQFEY